MRKMGKTYNSVVVLWNCPKFLVDDSYGIAVGQASFIRAILQGRGGLGGWVFSRVGGSKALDPHPSYNSEGFLGWAPATPSFFGQEALSGCLLVPFSALSLCRWWVCRWQFFRWRTFFLITS